MKINDLLTESHNLDEFDMPVFGKKAKMIRKAEKAGAADAAGLGGVRPCDAGADAGAEADADGGTLQNTD